MDLITYAVPGFFLLIVVELIVEKLKGTNYYRVNDSITSLTTGVLSQLVKVVKLLIPFTVYVMVYQNFALFELSENALVWVLAFIAYDFCYYWLHRCGHEMNLLWAAHVVHHSSEEYNLTTALRQTSTSFLSFVFYLPMALIGFDPAMVLTVGALNLIYQYWVHTRHIGKLGWFEWFFITPSNHRVHHAQNAVYIDRNYGGVFVLWDRLFGSFQEELDEQPVVFGIRGALASWNPLWANLQVYNQLFQDCLHTRNLWHKLTIWFRRTGWRPPDVVEQYPLIKTDLDNFRKFDTPLTTLAKVYAVLQYFINSAIALSLLFNLERLDSWQQCWIIGFVLFSSFSVGAMLEQRAFAVRLELFKNLLLISILLLMIPFNLFTGVVVAVSLTCIALIMFGLDRSNHLLV